jgi:hypothetical protein
VETVHELTNSQTQLNFGVLPYRESEIMYSQANIQPLNKIGWFPQWTSDSSGISKVILAIFF